MALACESAAARWALYCVAHDLGVEAVAEGLACLRAQAARHALEVEALARAVRAGVLQATPGALGMIARRWRREGT